MRVRHLLLAIPLVLACDDEKDSGPADGVSGISGSIEITGEDLTGAIDIQQAFGFNADGVAVLYLSSSASATCDDVVADLGTENVDPSANFLAGHCNVTVKIDYDGVSASLSSADGGLVEPTSLDCTLGDGAFEWGTQGGYSGYYWSEERWIGSPDTWSVGLTGGEGDDFLAELSMDGFSNGYFQDEGAFVNYAATGQVAGDVHVSWCAGIASTTIFQY